MKEKRQIKDFKQVLKDMEPMIKNPRFLWNGPDISNFSLRPREAWANWLLCAVLRSIHGDQITFTEDDDGDGILIDKDSKDWLRTEHVAAMDFPNTSLPKGEERVLQAIRKKTHFGENYSRNKILVVFLDGAELWYPNKVGQTLGNDHDFHSIFCVGLLQSGKDGYSYSVSQLTPGYSPTFTVTINSDFTDWKVAYIKPS